MERRPLGGSDLEITPVGVGTAPIGSVPGHWWVNWGQQDERDSIAAIHAALDGGVNWIDTARAQGVADHFLRAPFYGWGRDRVAGGGGSARGLREPSPVGGPCSRRRPRGGSEERPLSRSRGRSADSRRAKRAPRAGKRSEAERGKRRQCRAPLASGFLTDGFVIDALEEGDFRRTHPFAQRADLADLRREIGGTVGAIRFVLGHPAVTGAIVGVRNEREAREIVRSTP